MLIFWQNIYGRDCGGAHETTARLALVYSLCEQIWPALSTLIVWVANYSCLTSRAAVTGSNAARHIALRSKALFFQIEIWSFTHHIFSLVFFLFPGVTESWYVHCSGLRDYAVYTASGSHPPPPAPAPVSRLTLGVKSILGQYEEK